MSAPPRSRGCLRIAVALSLAAVVTLIATAGGAWYRIFGVNLPLVDGQRVGPATAIVDGFVALYAVPTNSGVLLVDAGADPEAAALTAWLEASGRTREHVRAVFLTHGHGDHIAGAAVLDAPVYALAAEAPLVAGEATPTSLVGQYGSNDGSVQVTHELQDGDRVHLDGVDVLALHVPGHTGGSAAFVIGDAVFLGDAANANQDGTLRGGVGIFTDDGAQNAASIAALADRLPAGVQVVGLGHSGPASVAALRALGP